MSQLELKKLDFIDSLRGWAVLGVICIHVYIWLPWHGPLEWFLLKGNRGVQLFYLLSAFTLFNSLSIRKVEKYPLINYFIRRFFRIAPLFYLSIIYYLWQDGWGPRYWLGDVQEISSANVLATFTFTNGWNPYWINSIVPGGWSIAVEMGFYLLLPLLFKYCKNIKSATAMAIFSFILMKFLQYILLHHPLISDVNLWREFTFLYLPSQLPIFCLGIILYFLWKNKGNLSTLSMIINYLISIGFIYLSFLWDGKYIAEHVLFAGAFLLMSFNLSKKKLLLLVNPLIGYLGKISFSLYLVHHAIINGLKEQHLLTINHFSLGFLLTILGSLVLGSITFYGIERPGMALGKQIIAKIEGNN